MFGRKIQRIEEEGQFIKTRLNINQYSSGMYFIKINIGEAIIVQPILIRH